MAWDTIHDYINDPAGFEAHHRQFKAQGGGIASGQVRRDWGPEQYIKIQDYVIYNRLYKGQPDHLSHADIIIAHVRKLEAVADAARAVRSGPALDAEQVGVRSVIVSSRDWQTLADVLDKLDGKE